MTWFRGLEHIVRENEPLAPYTWLRLGGMAKFFAEPTTLDELTQLVKRSFEQGIAARLLGGGSNLLIDDKGFDGLVLHLTSSVFCGVEKKGSTLTAGGGAKLGQVVSSAAREGLVGLEDLVGIPGTVGGALHGNAGNPHSDAGTWIQSAQVMTRAGEVIERRRADMRFSYRKSSLDELVILSAVFQLEAGDPGEVTKRMQKNWIVKQAATPASSLAQACMFKDSGGVSAAALIEQAGLKGTHIGDAAVSDHNANFVILGRGASSADVRELIDTLRKAVNDRLGVRLETALDIW